MQHSNGDPPKRDEYEPLKTGTTTVGLRTDDGVVLGTDSRVSAGGRFVSGKDFRKVEPVHPTAALTIAGTVSHAQALVDSVQTETRLYDARRGEPMSMTALSTIVGNALREGEFRCHPLLGGIDHSGPHLHQFDAGGGRLEKEYGALGSGMQLAYGVLEGEYERNLSLDDATTLAARAVATAAERDTASGNGIYLAEITADGVAIENRSLDSVPAAS